MPDLHQIIARNRAGETIAIPSVCTAHPDGLEACLTLAESLNQPIVVKATSNQVKQDGGCTGLEPADFMNFVKEIASLSQVNPTRFLFGGDHLGPQARRKRPADQALEKAHRMVADHAAAGFTKTHLDCSEGCAEEPAQHPGAITASRSADLRVTALKHAPDPGALRFAIGTKVPPPGGTRPDDHGDTPPTTPESARATLAAHREAASTRSAVLSCSPASSSRRTRSTTSRCPPIRSSLPLLATDPAPASKPTPPTAITPRPIPDSPNSASPSRRSAPPSPATGARRCMPATIRAQNRCATGPSLADTMEEVMLQNPSHWQADTDSTSADPRTERHFGLADRIRYHWPAPQAQAAVACLMADLDGKRLPDPLLSTHFRGAEIATACASAYPVPRALALAQVQTALRPHVFTGPRS